ncbi:MAG: hypothetical protein DRJ18_01940 [Candidatus Methanomethylicota archaeon]|nr:MAG: hypothetical protein DRJ18_01940 [Candidatus Verstraetearchaeota archaeon]
MSRISRIQVQTQTRFLDLVYLLEKKKEEIQQLLERRKQFKSNMPEYRRLSREIRKLDREILCIEDKMREIAIKEVRELESVIDDFVNKMKSDFKNCYDIVTLEKDVLPHYWRPITLYDLYGIFKRCGLPIDELGRFRAGVVIRFHWFNGDVQQIEELVKYVKEKKPSDVVVILSFDRRPDHSEAAYQLSNMVAFERKIPFQYDGVYIHVQNIVLDPEIIIL